MKILAVLLFGFGEALCIWSEIDAARSGAFWKPFIYITIAGVPLILGYIWGLRAFGDIWVVSILSIVTVLVAEPILIWVMFHQVPTIGALIGFILGAAGLVIATNW